MTSLIIPPRAFLHTRHISAQPFTFATIAASSSIFLNKFLLRSLLGS